MRFLALRSLPFQLKIRLLRAACNRINRRSLAKQSDASEPQVPGKLDILFLMISWGNIFYAVGLPYLSKIAARVGDKQRLARLHVTRFEAVGLQPYQATARPASRVRAVLLV